MSTYLEKLKNKKTATSGTAKAVKSHNQENNELPKLPEVSYDSKDSTRGRPFFKNRMDQLLSEVGGSITTDTDGSQRLKFNPFLAGPQVDAERWQKALELEELFFNQTEFKT